jgi:hypothetical protein
VANSLGISSRDGSVARQDERGNAQILQNDYYGPNKFVAEVHDRMPVLLAEKNYEPWLSGKAGLELLKPAAETVLQKWLVSKRVNSSRAPDDDSTLIEPTPLPGGRP